MLQKQVDNSMEEAGLHLLELFSTISTVVFYRYCRSFFTYPIS